MRVARISVSVKQNIISVQYCPIGALTGSQYKFEEYWPRQDAQVTKGWCYPQAERTDFLGNSYSKLHTADANKFGINGMHVMFVDNSPVPSPVFNRLR